VGLGKTTHLHTIAGIEELDSSNFVKANDSLKFAFLSHKFEVCASRTVGWSFSAPSRRRCPWKTASTCSRAL
jgi:ABC-type sulfate/molybdate transport systems ATPase subunit